MANKKKISALQANRAERRWVRGFSIFAIILTGLPYALAFLRDPNGFTGSLFGVEDGNSYIAKMLLGAQGDWLFRSPFSVVSQHGALLYLPYLLLGKLLGSGAQHASLVILFHAFRSLSIVALCFVCYQFLSFFIKKVSLRRLGLALVVLGSGLGWVLLLIGQANLLGSLPLDFYSPETFGFLAVFGLPHLVLARALLLWGLLTYLAADSKLTRPWAYSLLWLALALTHLITAGLGLLLIGIHLVTLEILDRRGSKPTSTWRTKAIYAGWAALGAAPVFIFNAWVFLHDSYLRAWATQNQILSPNIFHYLVAYGWLLPFAYLGVRILLRRDRAAGSFFAVWLLALPFLLYVPFGFQRRLAEAAWVMLVLLALVDFEQNWAKRKRQIWLFALAAPSTLILLLTGLQAATQGTAPVFVPDAEVGAFDQLRDQTQAGQVVLAPYADSNPLPAWAPLRVLVGHGPESVGPKQLPAAVSNFFGLRVSDDLRLQLLNNYHVDYVLWGPDQAILHKWDPNVAPYLRLIIKVGEYQIFAVVK